MTAGGREREYVMRKMYAEELAKLDAYAREQPRPEPDPPGGSYSSVAPPS